MRRAIYEDDVIKLLDKGWKSGVYPVASNIHALPSAEPEQKAEELLPDGTLHLFTDTDLSKVNRILVSQNGTHYGDLYYPDEWRWLV